MRRILLFSLTLLALLLPLRAQQVEWSRHFSGDLEILCIETDSANNVYLLGEGVTNPYFQNVQLGHGSNHSTFVLKLDADGNLLWSKAIYNLASVTASTWPNGMRLVGDSALYLLSELNLAKPQKGLFYLDTLYSASMVDGVAGPFPAEYSDPGEGSVLIRMDLDGNVREQHFIRMAALDSDGSVHYGVLHRAFWGYSPFWIDGEGNFYFTRFVGSYLEYDSRLYVDGLPVAEFHLLPDVATPMLFKMPPTLDTVLWHRPLIQGLDTANCQRFSMDLRNYLSGLTGDGKGGLYLTTGLKYWHDTPVSDLGSPHPYADFVTPGWKAHLLLDASDTSRWAELMYALDDISLLAKFDTDGNLLWHSQIKAANVKPIDNTLFMYLVHLSPAQLSDDQSLLYVGIDTDQGVTNDTNQYWTPVLYPGDTTLIPEAKKSAGFLVYDAATGQILHHAFAPTSLRAEYGPWQRVQNTLAVGNHRVATHLTFFRDLQMGDSTLTGAEFQGTSAYCAWSDTGTPLSATGYGTTPRGKHWVTHLGRGATLYLAGHLPAAGTFNGHPLPAGPYLLRLTDSAFLAAPTTPDDPDTTHTEGILTTDHSPLTTLSVEYYDVLGRRLPAAPGRGLYLVRTVTTQGVSTRKVARMTNL